MIYRREKKHKMIPGNAFWALDLTTENVHLFITVLLSNGFNIRDTFCAHARPRALVCPLPKKPYCKEIQL